MNGDHGSSDNCEFYLDIYRLEKSTESKDCYVALVPPSKPESLTQCSGYVERYFRSGTKASPGTFRNKLEETLKLGGEKSLVTITDHGNKVEVDCEADELTCAQKRMERESSFSVGEGSLNETELRQLILETREEQKKALCPEGSPDCKIPPLIMNFDHCYSGGMQNSLFDLEGKPLPGVCGISASSENELSYMGENIAKGINELRYGVQGKYRDYYRKYDKNNDGKFSVSEVFDYINVKAKKSVPLKTSDKFLLDIYKNSNLSLSPPMCSVETQDQLSSFTSAFGEMSYATDFEAFLEKAKFFHGKSKDLHQESLEALLKDEEEAYQVMLRGEEHETFLIKLYEDSIEKMSKGSYAELSAMEEELESLNLETNKLSEKYCSEDEVCRRYQAEKNELEIKLQGDLSDEESVEIYSKFTEAKKIHKHETEELALKSCHGKCPELFENHKKKIQLEENISLEEKKIVTEKSQDVIQENKKEVESLFQKFEDYIKPYSSPEIKKFLESKKLKMTDSKFLLKKNSHGFEKDFFELTVEISEKLSGRSDIAHQKYIKSRKAVNQLKMSSALKQMIHEGNSEKLEQYNMIKECEETPILEYKR